MRAVVPKTIEQGGGRIVKLTSYSAAKGASPPSLARPRIEELVTATLQVEREGGAGRFAAGDRIEALHDQGEPSAS